jgi:hypothetical protein
MARLDVKIMSYTYLLEKRNEKIVGEFDIGTAIATHKVVMWLRL